MQYDPGRVPAAMVSEMIGYFEWQVESGVQFKDGETIQFGWGVLKVQAMPDGSLGVFEPDLVSFPINWIDSVTGVLLQTLIQKYVAESLGFYDEADYPSALKYMVVCDNYADCPAVIMERNRPWDANDSGWRLFCADPDHNHESDENIKLVSLYECAVNKPQVVEYLALPVGIALFVVNLYDQLEFYFNGQRLQYSEDSYLSNRVALFANAA
jgi:hypothetical protein